MSEFVMGAKLEMTDAFKSPMSEAAKATEDFKRTTESTNNAVGSFVNTTTASTQAVNQFTDALQEVADTTQETNAATREATASVNSWKSSMQQFNRGTETLKNIPNTIRQIARSKLDGLENSITSTRLQAGLLVGGIKTLAKTKITNAVNGFKEFKATVTEGQSGLTGFAKGLKNIGKISIANTYNAMKNLTSKVKDFAGTKISGITSKLKEFKTNATGGEGGVKGLWNALKKAASVSFSGVHNGLSKIGGLASSAGAKITSSLGGAITGVAKGLSVGIAAAGAAMAGLTVKALNLGGELEQNIGGSEAVFKDMATTMRETGKTAFSSMGLSQSDFLATANKMGALFQGSGFDIKASADMSAKSMQRAADVASIMGLDVNDAMEAVAGAAKGNFTMMDNLGIAMNDTSIAAYAASKGIKKTSQQMTQQEKVGLAMEMFLEKTSYAAGNYAKENDTLAGSLTTAKAAMSNFLAGSGSVDDLVSSFVNASTIIIDNVTEIVPRLATGIAEAIGAIMPKVPGLLVDTLPMLLTAATQMFQSLIETVQQNKGPLISLAINIISSLAGFLLDAVPQIILIGLDVLLGFIDGIVSALPTLIPVAITAIQTLVNGLLSRMDMIIQSALTIIMGLVNGILQNLPRLIQVAFQLLQAIVSSILNNIQLIINTALTLVTTLVQGLLQNLPLLINAAIQLFMGILSGLLQNLDLIIQGAITLITTLITTLIQNLPMLIQMGVQIIVALIGGLIQAIPQLIAAIPQLVGAIVDTIMSTNWLQVGWDIVKGVGKGLLDGIKGFFGGGEKGGEEMAQGAATGLSNNMGTVSAASQATANTITTGLQPDYSVIGGYGATATTTLAEGFTANSTIAVDAAKVTGLDAMTGLSTGLTDNMGLTTDAATTITTDMTATFNDIDLFPTGKNAMEGLNKGLLSMKGTLMGTARSMANSIRNEINSALDIHSPSRVMEESGEYTGEGLIVGINKMISKVKEAARGLSDSTVEPFATSSASQSTISPSGTVATPSRRSEGLRIQIENIILSDVGNKNPKELVAEILKLLYEELSGADEVLSAGEMGALLT